MKKIVLYTIILFLDVILLINILTWHNSDFRGLINIIADGRMMGIIEISLISLLFLINIPVFMSKYLQMLANKSSYSLEEIKKVTIDYKAVLFIASFLILNYFLKKTFYPIFGIFLLLSCFYVYLFKNNKLEIMVNFPLRLVDLIFTDNRLNVGPLTQNEEHAPEIGLDQTTTSKLKIGIDSGVFQKQRNQGIMNDWGYVIQPQFDWACEFSENLAAVQVDEEWGFINKAGDFIIKPGFEGLGSEVFGKFSNGLACVEIDGLFGYINKNSEVVIAPTFSEAHMFSEGYALVGIEWKGLKGYINKFGSVIFSIRCLSAGKFSEGLAKIKYANDDRWGYINVKGEVVIEPQFYNLEGIGDFSEGLATVMTKEFKSGFVDKSGNFIIEPKYIHADSFSEGLAAVEMDGKWGYIDKLGTIVIEPQFYMADQFSNGLAPVAIDLLKGKRDDLGLIQNNKTFYQGPSPLEGTLWGYINKSGKYFIDPQFERASTFKEGYAAIKIKGKWGYLEWRDLVK